MGTAGAVAVTHKRHVWLLRLAARWILMGIMAGGSCFAPGIAALTRADATDLVTPTRWWRREATRGMTELEKALAD